MSEFTLTLKRFGPGGAVEEVPFTVNLDEPRSRRGLFEAAAVCPIRWRDIVEPPQAIREAELNGFTHGLGFLGKDFEHYWYRLVKSQFDADDESEFLRVIGEKEDDWPDRAAAVNLLRWYPLAEAEYVKRMSRFMNLRFATDNDQRKHYPAAGTSDAAVRQKTVGKEKASLLYERMRPDVMTEVMWMLLVLDVSDELPTEYREEVDASPMGLLWEKLLPPTGHHKVFVEADKPIGATGGVETKWLLVDCDMSTPQMHAFPVLETYPNFDTRVDGGTLYLTPMWQRRERMKERERSKR